MKCATTVSLYASVEMKHKKERFVGSRTHE